MRWIYSLEPGKAGNEVTRGLTGRIMAPADPQNQIGILEASYTDAGRSPVGSLTSRTTLTLRNSRVEAEASTELSGATVQRNDDASGREYVRANKNGDWARYASLNLSGVASVTCRAISAKAGGAIEFHRDSAQGEVLARLEVKPTGDENHWEDHLEEITAPLKPLNGRCDLFAVFVIPDQTHFLNLDWIQFNLQANP